MYSRFSRLSTARGLDTRFSQVRPTKVYDLQAFYVHYKFQLLKIKITLYFVVTNVNLVFIDENKRFISLKWLKILQILSIFTINVMPIERLLDSCMLWQGKTLFCLFAKLFLWLFLVQKCLFDFFVCSAVVCLTPFRITQNILFFVNKLLYFFVKKKLSLKCFVTQT